MWGLLTIASFALASWTPTEVSPGLFIALDFQLCSERPQNLELDIHPIWTEKVEVLQSATGTSVFVAICGVKKPTEFRIQELPSQLTLSHVMTLPGRCEKEGCVLTGMQVSEPGSFSYKVSRTRKKILNRGYRIGAEITVKVQAQNKSVGQTELTPD